jgi:hypothetical protein
MSMYNDKSRYIHHRDNIIKLFLSNIIILIGYVESKENIENLVTKGLSRGFVYNSTKRMSLKLLKVKECNDGSYT